MFLADFRDNSAWKVRIRHIQIRGQRNAVLRFVCELSSHAFHFFIMTDLFIQFYQHLVEEIGSAGILA